MDKRKWSTRATATDTEWAASAPETSADSWCLRSARRVDDPLATGHGRLPDHWGAFRQCHRRLEPVFQSIFSNCGPSCDVANDESSTARFIEAKVNRPSCFTNHPRRRFLRRKKNHVKWQV